MTRLAAFLTSLVLAGCVGARAQETRGVYPGVEFTLAPGETVTLKPDMKVRFVAVTEDSRCPRDVTCIWAGEVKIQLMIQVLQTESQVEILEGESTIAGAYRVTLVRVEPPRASTARIAPQDYRATLMLDKTD